MHKKTFIILLLGITLLSFTAFYAQKMYEGKVSIIARNLANNLLTLVMPENSARVMIPATQDANSVQTENTPKVPLSRLNSLCYFQEPEQRLFSAEYLGFHRPETISKSEIFKTVISFKNTGNTPWFSTDSNCQGVPIINLGTDRPLDRASIFNLPASEFESFWISHNRIKMKSHRVEPGEIGYFEFWSKAPVQDDIVVEYFTPVAEGISWLNNAATPIHFRVGNFDSTNEYKIPFAARTRAMSDFNVSAEKNIIIDISDQIMHLRIGEDILRTFPVSTGAYRTPTPYGTTKIKFKQEVRVGGKWPHYVMPKFMFFREGGYGIHALPSLRNDGGTYWREARNHIQQRVSHGCVRLLPEDAEIAYDFSEPGTRVTVQP